jgi:hypothetical protein
MTCFASDPREYTLTRASEAELLFGYPRIILPTVMVTQEIPTKPSLPDSTTLAAPITGKPSDRSPVLETMARLESGAGLVLGDQPPTEPETSLRPKDGLGTEDRMVMEPKDHLETEAVDLLEVVRIRSSCVDRFPGSREA